MVRDTIYENPQNWYNINNDELTCMGKKPFLIIDLACYLLELSYSRLVLLSLVLEVML